ncbi:MAG: tRNA preQ1(34) S-adenosylmethionine ribosyltransferase-isomerase QueA [Nitrospirae bacterium]|nr:tRNA preQ1(34) S-adenosylmethionine ribosyltransferase-isomerase QueA [Nitrospirota bacterium]
MKTADFDFFLPEELIATRPADQRDISRLLVLHRDGSMEHSRFFELPSFLNAGDMLILNDSKVFPARLTGFKPTGLKLDILMVSEISPGTWNIMSRGSYTGPLTISDNLSAHIREGKTASFQANGDLMELIWKVGLMPLPPYIRRLPDRADRESYQTVYAENEGSIAAPTAGLHFTKTLLDTLSARSVHIRRITLHVGIGTFRPVKTEILAGHTMEREFFELDPRLLDEISEVKQRGNRVIAVGTTTTRTLEGYLSGRCTLASSNGTIKGSTDIFIHEGYGFKAVDALVTNFHLPRSTPFMLAATLAGREKLLDSYRLAISMGYRFFSYGDAMLVL